MDLAFQIGEAIFDLRFECIRILFFRIRAEKAGNLKKFHQVDKNT